MPFLRYRALDQQGRTVSGYSLFRGEDALRATLRRRGRMLVTAESVGPGGGLGTLEKERLFDEIAALLEADLPLVEALRLVSTEKPAERAVLQHWLTGIESGLPLSRCAAELRATNDPIIVKMLEVGEAAGALAAGVRQIARYYGVLNRIRTRVTSALMYPALVMVVTCVAVVVLTTYVIPMFLSMFARYQLSLPWMTLVLIAVSDFVVDWGWLVAVVTVLLGWVGVRVGWFRGAAWYRFLDLLPVIGPFLKLLRLLTITQSLANLLRAEVRIHDAVALLAGLVRDPRVDAWLRQAARRVTKGEALSVVLADGGLFGARECALIRIGEASGDLASQFAFLAKQHENRLERLITRFTALFEPILIVFLALFIGFILTALYVPLFDILGGSGLRR
ncbi:type II secretion system F family protein [Acanthopleuribacter pedis]|uniref:General secretion pathway protein F n=1 Tax=Acanthopleuribacter pedis TaxID=442870 RepID=A0A8J7U5L6_9BACT|nr:type II secretion system F family protein [Acanthopleuribacter pedis]MBO1321842.1 type II secretion system F family protein [Acanthopleuribacter pedis]